MCQINILYIYKDSLSCFSFLPQCRTNVVKKLKLITYEKISLRHPCLWFPPTLPCQARERVSRRTWVVPGPARPGNSRATTPCCLPRDSCFSAGGEIEFENRQRKLTSCACAWIPWAGGRGLLSRDLMEKRDCNPGRLNFRGRTFKDSLSCFSFLPQCRTNVVKKLKLITYEKISLRHPCLWFPPTLPCQARERVSRRTWVVPGPARPGNSRATTPCCLPRDSCFSAGGEIEFENRQRKLTSCACAWIPFHVPLAHPLGDAQDPARETVGISETVVGMLGQSCSKST